MSKVSDARERLFKHGRPHIRPLEVEGRDLGILWAAYRKGCMEELGELTQDEFSDRIINILGKYYSAWMIEDKNHNFDKGEGAVGMMVAKFNGWAMEPHFLPFPWASGKNRIKSVVSFMQMARYQKGVGVLNVYSLEEDMDFFKHLGKKYGVMYYVGRIPRGDLGKDRYVFYGRGGDYFRGTRNEFAKV
jgi:hypothetical protein